jgi:dienelactone hydrolase
MLTLPRYARCLAGSRAGFNGGCCGAAILVGLLWHWAADSRDQVKFPTIAFCADLCVSIQDCRGEKSMHRTLWAKLLFSFLIAIIGGVNAGLAQTSPPPLFTYAMPPAMERAAVSDSGDHIALVINAGGKRRLIVIGRNGATVKEFPLNSSPIMDMKWAGDKMVLMTRFETKKIFGHEINTELSFVYPIDGGSPWEFFDPGNEMIANVRKINAVSVRDGRYYAYINAKSYGSAGKKQELVAYSSLFEVDLQTRGVRKIGEAPENGLKYRDWLVGDDGEIKAIFEEDKMVQIWTIYNSKREAIASGKSANDHVDLACFGAEPNTIIYRVLYSDQPKALNIFQLSLETGRKTDLTNGNLDVACDSRRKIVGYGEKGGTTVDRRFSPALADVMSALAKAVPDRTLSPLSWGRDVRDVLVWSSGDRDPGTLWYADIRNPAQPVMRPIATDYPLDKQQIGATRLIRYKAADGLELSAVLTLPTGRAAGNLPVIILPRSRIAVGIAPNPRPRFDWWAQAFASRGYAVVTPIIRGSVGSTPDVEAAGVGELGRKAQSDLFDAVGHLAAQGIVDPTRACIMGSSYGGYAAMLTATRAPAAVRCAVAVGGVSDANAIQGQDWPPDGDRGLIAQDIYLLAKQHGELPDRGDLSRMSPIKAADQAVVPLLLVHTKGDRSVPFRQSETMAKAMRKAGKPVTLVALPDEDHWLMRSDNRLAMLEAALAFVEKYNPADKP